MCMLLGETELRTEASLDGARGCRLAVVVTEGSRSLDSGRRKGIGAGNQEVFWGQL